MVPVIVVMVGGILDKKSREERIELGGGNSEWYLKPFPRLKIAGRQSVCLASISPNACSSQERAETLPTPVQSFERCLTHTLQLRH